MAAPTNDDAGVTTTEVRVRYKDTDCMKVAYYGNYLTYFEVGRVEYLRQRGLPMSEVDRRVHMPVVEATVRYVKPARLDDRLLVRCWISEKKRASFRFSYDIRDEGDERIAHGHTLHACQDPATGKLVGIPAWLAGVMVVAAVPTS
jgi:acyl-CoA thioester hydrolase